MDLEEYKKGKIKDYKLPSGLKIKTKDISPLIHLKIRKQFKDEGDDYFSPAHIEALFKAFIVSPVIPDEITVEDFTSEDFKAILSVILKQISLTDAKELEEIRDDNKDFST